MARQRQDSGPTSGGDLIAIGVVFLVVGAVMLLFGLTEGDGAIGFLFAAYAVMAVGGLLAQIGVVVVGVTMGMRRADWIIRVREHQG